MEGSTGSESSKYSECIEECKIFKRKMSNNSCKTKHKDNDSDEINLQNISNKRSEKLNKPCKNGFCYCFTSDSDQHVRRMKPKTANKQTPSRSSSKDSDEDETESSNSTEPNKQKIYLKCNKNIMRHANSLNEHGCHKHSISRTKSKHKQNYNLTARAALDENKNAPLIHIVQQIYADEIVSEVKINKHKLISNDRVSNKCNMKNRKKEEGGFEIFTEKTLKQIRYETDSERKSVSESNFSTNDDEFCKHNKQVQKRHSKGGELLKRRLSTNLPSTSKCVNEAPKKPPRRFSETTTATDPPPIPVTNYKDAEVIVQEFLKEHDQKIPMKSKIKTRKSFPLDKTNNECKAKPIHVAPSCPLLSEIEESENDSAAQSNVKWVSEKIDKMLNYEKSDKSNFESLKPEPKPQMGWVIPPKQNIDTVDGLQESKPWRESDIFNNFAKNMDSKSTPIKSSEFMTMRNRAKDCDKSVTMKESLENKSKADLSSASFTAKAKESTCDFIKVSTQKLVNLVTKISSKDKIQNRSLTKNVSCQTSDFNLDDSYEIRQNDKKANVSLQSPPGSYFSNSPKKRNEFDGFNFERKITSPVNELRTSKRLSFSPKKFIQNFSNRPFNNAAGESKENSAFYKSYQSEFSGDFSLNLMNDILLSIKAKLEASDNYAESVFQAAKLNDKLRAKYFPSSNEHGDEIPVGVRRSSNQTENHNLNQNFVENKISSEIEEDEIAFSETPSIQSLKCEIAHFYANNNPKAEYAQINKVQKTKEQGVNSEYVKQQSACNQNNCNESDSGESNEVLLNTNNLQDACSYDSVSASPPQQNVNQEKNTYHCNCTKRSGNQKQLKDGSVNTVESVITQTDMEPPVCQICYKCGNAKSYFEHVLNTDKLSEGRVVEDEIKSVKELVSFFETELCPNNTCNQDHSACYQTPEPSLREVSTTFQELKDLSYDDEDIYDEIPDQEIRSKSCPLPNASTIRKMSVGNQSNLTYASNDYRTNLFSKKKSFRYQFLKHQFRKSIIKGKLIFKKKRQNTSPNDSINSSTSYNAWDQSNLGIANLFTDDTNEPLQKTLEKAVFVFRKIPILENSIQAVEAERLLLFSKIRTDRLQEQVGGMNSNTLLERPFNGDESWIRIDEFELPIQADIEFSDFFNFFYVGVFTDGKRIVSTSYAEKHDRLIVFRNCNINFENITNNTKIKCDIYVLRLRKVLNTKLTKEQIKSRMEEINYLSDSTEQLLSRFKYQGSFQFYPQNFKPFQTDNTCTRTYKYHNKFCLHSTKSINLPIDLNDEKSVLLNYVKIIAKLEIVFNKFLLEGFLNVRSISSVHDWNKRWCKVENFNLFYWDYPQDCNNKIPICTYNLIECANDKIDIASQEDCPRPKSFYLKFKRNCIRNNEMMIFFSADNQPDLNYWLIGLNKILEFKQMWME